MITVSNIKKHIGRLALVLAMAVFFMGIGSGSAQALSLGCCSCKNTVTRKSNCEWFGQGCSNPGNTVNRVNKHVESEFTAHRLWFVTILWEDYILPAMM